MDTNEVGGLTAAIIRTGEVDISAPALATPGLFCTYALQRRSARVRLRLSLRPLATKSACPCKRSSVPTPYTRGTYAFPAFRRRDMPASFIDLHYVSAYIGSQPRQKRCVDKSAAKLARDLQGRTAGTRIDRHIT